MNQLLLKTLATLQRLQTGEEGQDLVEYALLVALIAFACTAGIGVLASSINSAFSQIAGALTVVTV